MGEPEHASWQKAVSLWFWQHEKEWNVNALPELRVQVAATRYRVPDLTVLDRDRPKEQIITITPLAVFEILSPEDTFQRRKNKLEDYRTMGIPKIRVIDPSDSTFYRYENRQLIRNDSFSHPSKAIAFNMHEIKELRD